MPSSRRWKYRVHHILEAIEKINQYTIGMDSASFAANSMVTDAVLRNFQIIGEAARSVPDDIQQSYPQIPWSDMQRMRHIVVHDYDRVDLSIIWNTVQKHLTPLVEPLRKLLKEATE
jgi:uncharacterized protein with HEPN domain